MSHPIRIRTRQNQHGARDWVDEAFAGSLEGALVAARTLALDAEGSLLDMIQIKLRPGYRLQDGQLRYSADWL